MVHNSMDEHKEGDVAEQKAQHCQQHREQGREQGRIQDNELHDLVVSTQSHSGVVGPTGLRH